MKKNRTKGYVLLGILFVVVNVITFVVPVQKNAAFWTTYGFTVVAFAAQLVIWKTAFGRDDTMKSKFLGLPILHIGIVYLVVQLVTFTVFLFASKLPVWSAVVVCVLIAGISAVCMIAADTGRNEIARVETKVQQKVAFLKMLQIDVELLADQESDPATKAALSQFAEKIRFSDPMSHEQLTGLEEQITAKVSEFKTASHKQELIDELNYLLEERNRKCKALK